MITTGSAAPDFTLKTQDGQDFHMADQKGKRILLSFHPLAWTSVCRDQMISLERNFDRFAAANTVAVGLSIDSVPCKKAWAEAIGVKLTGLLSDFWPHGAVAKLYGIFRENDGFSERANIIVDGAGKVVLAKSYPLRQVPDIEEILRFLETGKV